MQRIVERDWKRMRGMKDELLATLCGRILVRVSDFIANGGEDPHQTYLQVWKILREEDDTVSHLFDELKRSTAIWKLALWYHYRLIDKATLEQFSEETQDMVGRFIEGWQGDEV